jgi:hypothetical protein
MSASFGLGVFAIATSSGSSKERQRAAWVNKASDIVFLDAATLEIT